MDELRARLNMLELMAISEAVYLTTIDAEGFPQTRAMLNLRNKTRYPGLSEVFEKHRDDLLVYFTTNTSSEKIEQLKKNPKVSAYYCKPDEWRGLMLGGEIEIVTEPGDKHALWQEGWDMYYPGGPDDPDYAILRLRPKIAKYYHQLHTARLDLAPVR